MPSFIPVGHRVIPTHLRDAIRNPAGKAGRTQFDTLDDCRRNSLWASSLSLLSYEATGRALPSEEHMRCASESDANSFGHSNLSVT